MSFNRVLHYRFRLACCCAGVIAAFFFPHPANALTEEVSTTAPTNLSSQAAETASSSPTLNSTGDSNLHSTTDLRNEVTADPRRFQYELKVTVRGVYDDNINLSQTAHESDYYFTIEPILTLGVGNITSREDNYIRLDYAPSLFLFLDHSENDAVQHLISLEGQH
jgi:hypothetical protein